MNNWEIAFEAMKTGKKIRRENWPVSSYIFFIDGKWINEHGLIKPPNFNLDEPLWLFYKEPAKLVKWYYPKVAWYIGGTAPRLHPSRSEFHKNKDLQNWLASSTEIKVLEWHEIEAPETWEECEGKE
jgi:hypothetical protein